MLDLRTHIEEALFDKNGPDPENLSKAVEIEVLKKHFYKLNPGIFDGTSGSVKIGPQGLEIEAPWKTAKTNSSRWSVTGIQSFQIKRTGLTKLPQVGIKKFTGSIEIMHNRNLESLEGFFDPDCEFHGMIRIWDNPKLKSIKGLPKVLLADPGIPGKEQNPSISILDCPLLGPDEVKYLPQCPWVGWMNNMPLSGLIAKHRLFKAIRKQTGCKNI